MKKKLDLPDFRFHDLRHEAVSRLVEGVLSDQEVSAISPSGLETLEEMKHPGQRYITGEIDLDEFLVLSQKMRPDSDDSQPHGTQ